MGGCGAMPPLIGLGDGIAPLLPHVYALLYISLPTTYHKGFLGKGTEFLSLNSFQIQFHSMQLRLKPIPLPRPIFPTSPPSPLLGKFCHWKSHLALAELKRVRNVLGKPDNINFIASNAS